MLIDAEQTCVQRPRPPYDPEPDKWTLKPASHPQQGAVIPMVAFLARKKLAKQKAETGLLDVEPFACGEKLRLFCIGGIPVFRSAEA